MSVFQTVVAEDGRKVRGADQEFDLGRDRGDVCRAERQHHGRHGGLRALPLPAGDRQHDGHGPHDKYDFRRLHSMW